MQRHISALLRSAAIHKRIITVSEDQRQRRIGREIVMASRTTKFGILSVAALAAGMMIAAPAAHADWRHGHRYRGGGNVAAGLIGGLALGALAVGVIASSRPAYAYQAPPPRHGYGYGYAPAPVYDAQPRVVYDRGPFCEIRCQKVWLDSWTYEVRKVRICH